MISDGLFYFIGPGKDATDHSDTQDEVDLEKTFFQVEREVGKGRTRESICLDDEREKGKREHFYVCRC